MDIDVASSSSCISSSESETGIFTNDEGREGIIKYRNYSISLKVKLKKK